MIEENFSYDEFPDLFADGGLCIEEIDSAAFFSLTGTPYTGPAEGVYGVASISYGCCQREAQAHLCFIEGGQKSEALIVGTLVHKAYPTMFSAFHAIEAGERVEFEVELSKTVHTVGGVEVTIRGYADAVVYDEYDNPILICDLKTTSRNPTANDGYEMQLSVYAWLAGVHDYELHYAHKRTGRFYRVCGETSNTLIKKYLKRLARVHACIANAGEGLAIDGVRVEKTWKCKGCPYAFAAAAGCKVWQRRAQE